MDIPSLVSSISLAALRTLLALLFSLWLVRAHDSADGVGHENVPLGLLHRSACIRRRVLVGQRNSFVERLGHLSSRP